MPSRLARATKKGDAISTELGSISLTHLDGLVTSSNQGEITPYTNSTRCGYKIIIPVTVDTLASHHPPK